MSPEIFDIISSYRKLHGLHIYSNRVKDRFGYWDSERLYDIPHYTENTLENCAIDRAKELGSRYILWSGGVDSTFIICAYIQAKVDFVVVCDKRSIRDGKMFYDWMLKNNVNVYCFDDIIMSYKLGGMVHGDVADQLFSPDEKRRTTLSDDVSFYDNLEGVTNRDRLYSKILEYGKYLGKPTDTNKDIIRLMNFGCMYLFGRDELNFLIFPEQYILSFFDTQEFNNISYTYYWHRSVEYNKPEMHRFICSTTNDDRFMWGVYRKGTSIPSRLLYTKENYVKYTDRWCLK